MIDQRQRGKKNNMKNKKNIFKLYTKAKNPSHTSYSMKIFHITKEENILESFSLRQRQYEM